MTADKLYELLGNTDEQLVKESEECPDSHTAIRIKERARTARSKWLAAAVCLCIAVCMALPFVIRKPQAVDPPDTSGTQAPTTDGSDAQNPNAGGSDQPHILLNGIEYYISPKLSISAELPDGFTAAEDVCFEGSTESYPCFVNPDVPEWIYLYYSVRTDGETDEHGTLITTAPHKAYVRYVDSRLRGKDLICYNGEYYLSMWHANYFGDTPDVTREYFDQMHTRYGVRMEGDPPEGFVFAGEAVFTGYDTVPTGTLASNKQAGDVYRSPVDPDVLLMATKWTTSRDTGKTHREGFDVYVRYDCPFSR